MSEAKLISPMLDGFAIGGPISDHHGIRCYPAMPGDSDKRYIVKVISIPASQVQLDALLLAGAYSSKDSALAYFKELADGVAKEADILKKLSRFEGFIPFEDLQIEPKDDGTGYDVYLLSPYKRSLERHMRKTPMTHLNAVNLGLDLCASMVVCRRKGYLYVDLKPSNIYINEKKEFRIGDLGFVKLDSLNYASLPDKYRSSYTAPEISDAWSSLNDTLDTYAIGMILYQVYNDGKLPFEGQAGSEELPPPLYADYEMAEIILKAIAPKPELRWSDPMLMGQALVAYMQRNTVNDVSIVPLPDTAAVPAAPVIAVEVPATAEEESAPEAIDQEVPASAEEEPAPEAIDQEVPAAAEPADEIPVEEPAPADDADVELLPGLILEEDVAIEIPAEEPAAEPDAEPADELTDLSFMDEMVSDDTAPDTATADTAAYADLSDDTSDMLALADELIALEMPEPVVAPEPIDIPMPAPIVLTDEPESETEAPAAAVADELPAEDEVAEEEAAPAVPVVPIPMDAPEEEEEAEYVEKKPIRWGGIIAGIIAIILFAAIAFGGYWYYSNFYLQTVDSLRFEGEGNDLIVLVDSDVDENLLTVVCTDTYGTTRTAHVKDGKAVFEDLNPDTIYQVKVIIDGFHELKGEVADDYTTPAQTNIVRFDAITGSDNGSVVLNFTVDGKDSDTWTVTYSTEGEQAKSVTFSGHLITISGLTMGKEYTFTLSGSDGMYIVGNDTVTYTTTAVVYAEDLAITTCDGNGLTAVWAMPKDSTVESWKVRCYNDSGYDVTLTTTELTCTFTDVDPSMGYTVEVIAQGMSVGTRAYVSAKSATITGFHENAATPMELTISWDFTGATPTGGWLVLYNLRGNAQQEIVKTTENTVTITNVLPGGVYEITVQAADGSTIFGGSYTSTASDLQIFSGYGINVEEDIRSVCMLVTPDESDWTINDVNLYYDPTDEFVSGEKMSLVIELYSDAYPETSNDLVTTLFVVRDEEGNLVSLSSSESSWVYMWDGSWCCLDVPSIPTTPGDYNLSVYFNSMAVTLLYFTVTE